MSEWEITVQCNQLPEPRYLVVLPNAKIKTGSPREQRYYRDVHQRHQFTAIGCVPQVKYFRHTIILQSTARARKNSRSEIIINKCFVMPRTQSTYPSNNKTMCSSSNPPTTLNFRKLHTCVFSYLPNFIFFTIAGRCNFSVKNCGGVFEYDDHRDTWLFGQSSRIFLANDEKPEKK